VVPAGRGVVESGKYVDISGKWSRYFTLTLQLIRPLCHEEEKLCNIALRFIQMRFGVQKKKKKQPEEAPGSGNHLAPRC
jgi:hypothetical protein